MLLLLGIMIIIKALCNFGTVVYIKDNDDEDVFQFAIKYARYKITEQYLSGSLGHD